jgi:hypothetical protein
MVVQYYVGNFSFWMLIFLCNSVSVSALFFWNQLTALSEGCLYVAFCFIMMTNKPFYLITRIHTIQSELLKAPINKLQSVKISKTTDHKYAYKLYTYKSYLRMWKLQTLLCYIKVMWESVLMKITNINGNWRKENHNCSPELVYFGEYPTTVTWKLI